MKLVIIDYGMGNTKSIQNAFNFLGQQSIVTNDPKAINEASAYILPGVGAFHEAMENINKLDLKLLLDDNILGQKKPILGICLGMQILAKSSEEIRFTKGLGYFDARVQGINNTTLRVPHVGWNSIEVKNKNPLFAKISSDTHFYFDHSFHFIANEDIVSSTTLYGEEITASIQKDNIFATQFHPEKSQAAGLKLLRSFLNYVEKQC
jgi:glutamine amidotransferase